MNPSTHKLMHSAVRHVLAYNAPDGPCFRTITDEIRYYVLHAKRLLQPPFGTLTKHEAPTDQEIEDAVKLAMSEQMAHEAGK